MNFLMAGMVPVMTFAMAGTPASRDPSGPGFWFIMSMALVAGFITAYPINWWLVSRHMKHGMITVQPRDESVDGEAPRSTHDNHASAERAGDAQPESKPPMDDHVQSVSSSALTWMIILSFLLFGLGLSIAVMFSGL